MPLRGKFRIQSCKVIDTGDYTPPGTDRTAYILPNLLFDGHGIAMSFGTTPMRYIVGAESNFFGALIVLFSIPLSGNVGMRRR